MKKAIALVGMILTLGFAVLSLSGCGSPVVVVPKPVGGATTATTSPSPSGDASAAHQVVTVTEKGFSPEAVTINAGGSVVWSNKDKVDHAVDLSPAGPKSETIAPGKTSYHKFPDPGTYTYKDPLHPEMTGKVVVQ